MKRLPNKEFQKMVPFLREEEFYEPEEQRKISWREYSQNEIEEAKEVLIFIQEAVESATTLTLKGKVGRHLTDPKSLAKAVLITEALHFTERNAQVWLSILSP